MKTCSCLSIPGVPLERFYTLDLDARAKEKGYTVYLKPVEGAL